MFDRSSSCCLASATVFLLTPSISSRAQQAIRAMKTEFNNQFNIVYKQKQVELSKIAERNERIRYIYSVCSSLKRTSKRPLQTCLNGNFSK